MYRDFFELEDYPFRLTADARYFFMGSGHALAKAYLNYLLHVRDGIGIVTGESGVGKTTVLEHAIEELEEEVVLARVQQTQLSPTEFLLALCLEFGIEVKNYNKAHLIHQINEFALSQHFSGKVVIVVVDEAQRLRPDVLEEIRMLSNLEKHGRKIFNVLLVGQPILNQLLNVNSKEPLAQRIRLRCNIDPLTWEETKRYIEYRLFIAGGEHTVNLPDSLLPTIHRFSGGIPRLINVICDMLLIAACIRERKDLDKQCLMAAIGKLGWVPYCERIGYQGKALESLASVHQPVGAKLRLCRDGHTLTEILLNRERMVAGRSKDADIYVNSGRASRFHLQIVQIGKGFFVHDLNSTNGTYINGFPIIWHRLRHGEIIQLGEYDMEYIEHPSMQKKPELPPVAEAPKRLSIVKASVKAS